MRHILSDQNNPREHGTESVLLGRALLPNKNYPIIKPLGTMKELADIHRNS